MPTPSPSAPHESLGLDAAAVARLLDGIPGAWERATLGLAQAESGDTFPFDEL